MISNCTRIGYLSVLNALWYLYSTRIYCVLYALLWIVEYHSFGHQASTSTASILSIKVWILSSHRTFNCTVWGMPKLIVLKDLTILHTVWAQRAFVSIYVMNTTFQYQIWNECDFLVGVIVSMKGEGINIPKICSCGLCIEKCYRGGGRCHIISNTFWYDLVSPKPISYCKKIAMSNCDNQST